MIKLHLVTSVRQTRGIRFVYATSAATAATAKAELRSDPSRLASLTHRAGIVVRDLEVAS